jgi:perosamine synthetase
MIELAQPDLTEAEAQAVLEVVRSGRLARGPQTEAFEQAFADRCRTRHAAACSSGTAALHLIWRGVGVQPAEEVITTPFSFIASSNSIMFEGAVPVFVDIDPHTWNIDPSAIAAAVTHRTRAILPVHVFGQIADMEPILATAKKHGLVVVEDACEALGGLYGGRPAGSLGAAAAFGFYPNKQITTGEGGMVTTGDADIHAAVAALRNQGRTGSGWLAHELFGYNYRIDELSAAVGRVQLSRLDELLAARQRVAEWYCQRLANEPRVVLQRIHPDVTMSWFVFVVRLSDESRQADRDRILTGLSRAGIGCSNYFAPIHLQPFMVERFGYRRGMLPNCEHIADRTIALPFHPRLSEGEVEQVVQTLTELL